MSESVPKLSLPKKLGMAVLPLVLLIAFAEAGARFASFLYYDFNPYYLLFGYKAWSTEEGHSEKYDGYFKFPANRMIEYGTPEPAHINNFGFRGPDFEVRKEPGTFRIVCLGASSTFGYTNRDSGTYPALLQRLLEDSLPGIRVEVINAGIPHMNTDNILAMFKQEILEYEPDLITLYSGYNDAVWPVDENALQRVQRWLDGYSAAYAAIRKGVTRLGFRMHNRWVAYVTEIDQASALRQLELHEVRYRENVSELDSFAKEKGIRVVLIKQIITSWMYRQSREPRPAYEEEYRRAAEDLKREGYLFGEHMSVYIHYSLMEVLEDLARAHQTPLVDNIALVDERPEGLVTRVHLSEEANARLAEKLHATIRPLVEQWAFAPESSASDL